MLVWAMPWPVGYCCFAIATMLASEILVTPSFLRCSTSVSTARLTISKVRCRFGSYTAASSQAGAWCGGVLQVDVKVHLWFAILIFTTGFDHVHLAELCFTLPEFLFVLSDLQSKALFSCLLNLDE